MGKNTEAGSKEGWFQVLEKCRALQAGKNDAPFTAETLAQFANLADATHASSSQIASAWLGKFASWGYVTRGEPIKTGKAGRPISTYLLTEDGMNCTERPGRLTRLIRAVISFAAARGTAKEAEAYKTLLETCRQVEKNDAGER